MPRRDIIVIGASAGGLQLFQELVSQLPGDLPASVFIVWHIPADSPGYLPQILQRTCLLPVAHAVDDEPIRPGRIYVAPPDRHLLLEPGRMRLTRGPKENRFRPAIDPLFRSAAHAYGPRAIGVILSGGLDDGTSGLLMIKDRSGIAIVQDPREAEVRSMPESALRQVKVDYCVPVAQMPTLLLDLVTEEAADERAPTMEDKQRTELEVRFALGRSGPAEEILKFGELSPLTCPECHGALVTLKEGGIQRFRCHTGHAFSEGALLASVAEAIEGNLWNTLRAMEESVMLLRQVGAHLAAKGEVEEARRYEQKAEEAQRRAKVIQQEVLRQEPLLLERPLAAPSKEG